MCVAVATGLFDSAINYAWNSAIIELREKVRRFGLNVVSQITGGAFDEKGLIELKDADLLSLCLKLNLITEDVFFMLDQCRAVRNNFSSAHPTMGRIDDAEFLNFLSRCVRYALSDERNPKGVDTQALLKAVKAGRFSDEQEEEWEKRLKETHDAQRELIVSTLHGLYCDPAPSQEARLNALDLCKRVKDSFSPAVTSELINRHSDYVAHGDSKRRKASETFFIELGLLKLLSEADQHTLVSNACRQLWSVHQGFDNFYNEPPFAERLSALTQQIAIPETAKREFVEAVASCAVGNGYGVSWGAEQYYHKMIRGLSPREIEILFDLLEENSAFGRRVKHISSCRGKFSSIVRLIERKSVPAKHKKTYDAWLR
jgi:hypothetical protein